MGSSNELGWVGVECEKPCAGTGGIEKWNLRWDLQPLYYFPKVYGQLRLIAYQYKKKVCDEKVNFDTR